MKTYGRKFFELQTLNLFSAIAYAIVFISVWLLWGR